MNTTPQGLRKHISIFGETNAGKSALFNAILGQEIAIVSDVSGTTTDPISKSMELLPFGPVVLVDTAGLNDKSQLGESRRAKTNSILDRTDLAIYAVDISRFNRDEYDSFSEIFAKKDIPYLIVLTKKSLYTDYELSQFADNLGHTCIMADINHPDSIETLKSTLAQTLTDIETRSDTASNTLIGDILPSGSHLLLVAPIDSEAPTGRLILPQVQLIRDCLDNGMTCTVTTEKTLEAVIKSERHINLIVTDSQVFKLVSQIVPAEIPLTSFSILLARKKGSLDILLDGLEKIPHLNDGAKILIAETCTHNHSHEDIGRVKIPTLLNRHTKKALEFTFSAGRDYPSNLESYDLIIHCGGCMITKREMRSRIQAAVDKNVAITNYGLLLSYVSGTLSRSIELFTSL